jgi:hypothetical protein
LLNRSILKTRYIKHANISLYKMPRKTRRNRNSTPPKKREKSDFHFVLKLKIGESGIWHDLVVVPYRDMLGNMVQEGIGNYIGFIEGIPADFSLLDANKEAGKHLHTLNEWSSPEGSFKIGTVYWVTEETTAAA